MKNRWMLSLVLVCSVAVVMPGCKKWFTPKDSGSGVGNGPDVVGKIGDGTGGIGGTGSQLPGPEAFGGKQLLAGQFDTVLFAYDSAQVEDAQRAKVEKVAEFMKGNSSSVLSLEGHCDERGSAEYNMSLGDRRALAVRTYLMHLGIDGSRIQTKSFGKEKPKDLGHDEAAWAINRRVEFVVMK